MIFIPNNNSFFRSANRKYKISGKNYSTHIWKTSINLDCIQYYQCENCGINISQFGYTDDIDYKYPCEELKNIKLLRGIIE